MPLEHSPEMVRTQKNSSSISVKVKFGSLRVNSSRKSIILIPELPYYRKLTLVLIKVLEINAT